MNNIKGIIYLSNATADFDKKDLQILARKAEEKNKLLDITGYLYFEKKLFLQYIEGNNKDVQILMNHIQKDPRHEVINVLQNPNLLSRNFSSWYMQYLTKEMLVEMKIEHLIIEQMKYIKKINAINNRRIDSIEKENSVWRMINTISKIRNKLY